MNESTNTKLDKGTVNVPATESAGASHARDKSVWERLGGLLEQSGHSQQHILECWPAYVRRVHIGRFLALYELFKLQVGLPGCIVELGVYRGLSFFWFAKLMEMFEPGDRKRQVIGFDGFKGLGQFHAKDGIERPELGKSVGAWDASAVREEVLQLVDIVNQDGFIPTSPRCQIVEGQLEVSIPKFLHDNPGLRISLLHLDVDLYEPTKRALELLYPHVVKGGIVVFDEYGFIPWEGESKAAEEYFEEAGIGMPVMRKFPYSTQPHGYFIK
jgi:hypothetical protein